MLGFRDTMGEMLGNPELRKHTAARAKEEAEIHKERRKAAEKRGLSGGHAGRAQPMGSGPKGCPRPGRRGPPRRAAENFEPVREFGPPRRI